MFVQDDSAPRYVRSEQIYDSGVPAMFERIQELERQNHHLQRLVVGALHALAAADGLAYEELVERVKGWS